MFATPNGTGVLFIPAYIDHGSTSGQSNGASRYVMLGDEQEVEEEEVDQKPPNRPPSHSEALQHVHPVRKRLYPFFIFIFFLGAHCVKSGVSCTDCY